MKATKIEVLEAELSGRNGIASCHHVFARVHTDEGISGLGEVGTAYGTGEITGDKHANPSCHHRPCRDCHHDRGAGHLSSRTSLAREAAWPWRSSPRPSRQALGRIRHGDWLPFPVAAGVGKLPFFDGIESLATWCDFLVISAPGTLDTYQIVNASVLSALGCQGSLINGAALDVYKGQPETPRKLAGLPNLLITPHVASRSPESMNNMVSMALENLDAYMDAKDLISPVP